MKVGTYILFTVIGSILVACDGATGDDPAATVPITTADQPPAPVTSIDAPSSSVTTEAATSSIWDPSRPETDLVLEVTVRGGLVTSEFYLTLVPYLVVYADGSLLTGVDTDDHILRPVVRIPLDDEQRSELDALVHAMNLTEIDEVVIDWRSKPGVYDYATTVATYTDPAGVEHRFAVYAVMTGGDEYSPEEQALGLLVDRYRNLGSDSDGEPYVPERIQLYLLGGTSGEETMDWPLRVEPDRFAPGPDGIPCLVVTGDLAAGTAGVLADVDRRAVFTYRSQRYALLARVVLPHERDPCGPTIGSRARQR